MGDTEKVGLDDVLRDGTPADLNQFKSINGSDMADGLGNIRNHPDVPLIMTTSNPDVVVPFPLDIIPVPLADVITQASESIGVPPDLIAIPMLVIAGSAIGAGIELEIKQGWREGANLYAGIVSPPGDRKTPAIKTAAGPVYGKQKEFSDRYKKEIETYQQEMAAYRVKFSSWKSRYKKALKDSETFSEEQPAEPRKPILSRTFTTDSTTEALGEILHGNPDGILLIKDELSGWVRSMDQYRSGKGADLQFYLSAWSRAHIVVDRKNNPDPKSIHTPFISVIGGIPPDVLEELVGEKKHEDGFIHRILFCCPDPIVPDDGSIMKPFPDQLAQVWNDVYLRLRDLPIKSPPPNPRVIRLSDEGEKAWVDFIKRNRKELSDRDFPTYLKGPWAKFEGHCARFALIIHELRFVSGDVDSEDVDGGSVLAAQKVVDYFKSHIKRVYRKLHLTMADKKAQHLVDWIQRRGGKCSASDLIANGVTNILKATEAIKALNDLTDRGFGHMMEEKTASGPKRKLFVLHGTVPNNPVSS